MINRHFRIIEYAPTACYNNIKAVTGVSSMKIKAAIASVLAIVLAISALGSVGAGNSLRDLAQCRKVYAYSGESAAYFYGYANQMLCSARVIPDVVEKTVTTDGVIRAVSHDETCAYALLETSHHQHSILKLDMNSGEYRITPLVQSSDIIYSSFAVADGEVFLLTCGTVYDRVSSYDIDGNKLYTYDLDRGVKALFHNGGSGYAVSYSGEICRLSYGNCTSCARIPSDADCRNAGIGYIEATGALVSLTDGNSRRCVSKFEVISGGEVFTSDSGILFAAACSQKARLDEEYSCFVESVEDSGENREEPENKRTAANNEDILVVDAGMTVSALKKSDALISEVYDNYGEATTAGMLRTGYSVRRNGAELPLAVRGDLNMSGTVNSRDITALMNYLVGNITLNRTFCRAADLNDDDAVDTRDLVLLDHMVKRNKEAE